MEIKYQKTQYHPFITIAPRCTLTCVIATNRDLSTDQIELFDI